MNEINNDKVYKVVFYARVSTEEEKQINSLGRQIEELTAFIRSQPNWLLVDHYIDEGKTGTTSKGRYEYNRLYNDILTNKFDIIVIKDISRMNRNTCNYYQFINRIITEGKKLYMYLDHKFYSSDDSLINGIKAMMAEEYSRDLSRKIGNASQRSIEKGVAYGNGRLYGYVKTKQSFAIDEEQAKVVRQIFEWYAQGYGFRTIQRMLTEQNILSSNGTPFALTTLKRMIKNEKYKGLLVSGKTHYNFETKKIEQVPKEDRKYFPNGIAAIVSEELWDRANEILTQKIETFDITTNKRRGKKVTPFMKGQSALSGKIFCGKCGKPYWHSPYVTQVNKLPRDIWLCSTYRSKGAKYCKNHTIEFDKILDETKQILFLENTNCNNVRATIDILRQALDDGGENSILSITQQIEKQRKRLNSLTDLLLDGVVGKQEYIAKKEEVSNKISSLQSSLERAYSHRSETTNKEKRLQDIQSFLETNITNPSDITDDDIRKFIKKILVYDDNVVIETESGNSYDIDPDTVKLKFMSRKKEYLEKMRVNRIQSK